MQEAERRLRFALERAPVLQRRLQQHIGADDIGLDEGRGAGDGAVHVALGGQMDHRVGPVLGEGGGHGRGVADVGLQELIMAGFGDVRRGAEARRIGQLVDVHHLHAAPREQATHRRTDKSGAAGDQDFQG